MRRTSFVLAMAACASLLGPTSLAAPHPAAGSPPIADFDGDGFGDLAVSVPQEDVNGQANAGAVHVLYGSAGGLQATAPDDQVWTQDSSGVEDLAEVGDHFGWSVAAADFDGDGFTDLAMGAYQEDVGSIVDAGAVNVLYGSAGGLQTGSPPDQFWHQDSPQTGGRAEEGDNFARSLTTGDFNGDGFHDLTVGIPAQDVSAQAGAGAVHQLYGSAGGLQATAPDDQVWHQNAAGVADSSEAGDEFGWSLAAGDFNGDGFDDLAVGIDREDLVAALSDVGAVAALYGGPGGLQADAPDDQFWTQDAPGMHDRAEAGDLFGLSLASGDFNGDGFGDLAIGVLQEDIRTRTGTFPDAGAAEVMYGSENGLQTILFSDQFWTQEARGVRDQPEDGDQFSHALAVGDFDGDGFADLAIGVHHEDLGALSEAGAAHVLYGSADGLQAADDQFWHQDTPGVEDVAEASDFFALALAAGDYNGDGYGDLASGVRDEDVGAAADGGAVNALYGSPAGIQAVGDQLWHEDVAGVEDEAEGGDEFGWKLA